MKAAHTVRLESKGREFVKAGELIEARFANGLSPSLAARKVLSLLFAKAGGDAWKPGIHTITKRELRGSHESNDRLRDIFEEVRQIRFVLPTISRRGYPALLSAPLIAYDIEETVDEDTAIIEWEFTEPARAILQGSDYYARMNKAALLAFESKYSVTLYELGAELSGRREPFWRGTVEALREKIGVEPGKYRDWTDVRRKTLEQAKLEIDHLAHFTLTWSERREGRKVVEVELCFYRKDDEQARDAVRELERPRVGRKARRKGAVEKVVEQAAESKALIESELRTPLPTDYLEDEIQH